MSIGKRKQGKVSRAPKIPYMAGRSYVRAELYGGYFLPT